MNSVLKSELDLRSGPTWPPYLPIRFQVRVSNPSVSYLGAFLAPTCRHLGPIFLSFAQSWRRLSDISSKFRAMSLHIAMSPSALSGRMLISALEAPFFVSSALLAPSCRQLGTIFFHCGFDSNTTPLSSLLSPLSPLPSPLSYLSSLLSRRT